MARRRCGMRSTPASSTFSVRLREMTPEAQGTGLDAVPFLSGDCRLPGGAAIGISVAVVVSGPACCFCCGGLMAAIKETRVLPFDAEPTPRVAHFPDGGT
jgi:hypothetical protein